VKEGVRIGNMKRSAPLKQIPVGFTLERVACGYPTSSVPYEFGPRTELSKQSPGRGRWGEGRKGRGVGGSAGFPRKPYS
jgi:hypothetical protein